MRSLVPLRVAFLLAVSVAAVSAAPSAAARPAAPLQTSGVSGPPSGIQTHCLAGVRGSAVARFEQSYVPGGCSWNLGQSEECLNVYVPAQRSPCAPTVLWIHGGGWSLPYGKDDAFNDGLCTALASNGIPVVSCNYYLSTYKPCNGGSSGANWFGTIQEIKQVIDWIKRREGHTDYELPTKIVVAGSSAGAHLAAMMATTGAGEPYFDPTADSYKVSLAILYSPPLDFVDFGCFGLPYGNECGGCAWTVDGVCNPCPSVPLYRGGPVAPGYLCTDPHNCFHAVYQEIFLGQRWDDPLLPPLSVCVPYACGDTESCGTVSFPKSVPCMPSGNPWFDASPYFWLSGNEPSMVIFQAECDGYIPARQGEAFKRRFDCLNPTKSCTVTTLPVSAMTPDCGDVGCQHAAEGISFQHSGLIAVQIRDIVEAEFY